MMMVTTMQAANYDNWHPFILLAGILAFFAAGVFILILRFPGVWPSGAAAAAVDAGVCAGAARLVRGTLLFR